jgi:hypothetical protein
MNEWGLACRLFLMRYAASAAPDGVRLVVAGGRGRRGCVHMRVVENRSLGTPGFLLWNQSEEEGMVITGHAHQIANKMSDHDERI